jgi:hypothetical protein
VPVDGLSDECRIVDAPLVLVDRLERRLGALEMQRVKPARYPQGQRIGQRCTRPVAYGFQQRTAFSPLDKVAQIRAVTIAPEALQ